MYDTAQLDKHNTVLLTLCYTDSSHIDLDMDFHTVVDSLCRTFR